ncbi:sugar ABC transporter permease [Brachybacterium endophyticum]|uniref:Sugar ABC transporter permease n=1 Tax=Brachybacterium endophyticum TaxID=2182385 RepID=A0A2U2RN15_9MICO|nr:sugar ABC transporter permease [Brachybacterium endophyticum]PWH07277.1 sugar ABC transporter permease [Brachybacterium endophyticum]
MTTASTPSPSAGSLAGTSIRGGSRRRSDRRGRPSDRGTGPGAWLFIAPFGLFYLAFLLGPTVWMFVASFFNTSLVHSGLGSFAGLDNYVEMFSRADFWSALWHTLQFTLYTVPPLVILAFVFAVLTNRLRRGQWFFRLAFFLPFILPSATISLIWVFIFTPATGLWASVQSLLGFTPGSGILADPKSAMVGIAIATVWWTIGFNFILYLAGLQDIPRELYEAAAVDGATTWQQIRHVTVPLLRRTTTLVILLQIIASLKIFDQVYLMTSGGPGVSTQVSLGLITGTAFTDNRIGAASAASVLLFVIIVAIAVIREIVERVAARRDQEA